MSRILPDHVYDDLQPVIKATYDEKQSLIDDGNQEFEGNRVAKAAVGDLTTNTDYTSLGWGAGRVAVTHPDIDAYAVKIAVYSPRSKHGYPIDGVSQNQQESWTSDNLPDPLKNRFTPVRSIIDNGRLLVMPIVTTDHDEIPYDDALQFVEETKSELRVHGWESVGLDVNAVGKRNGELEIFDYGLPVEPADSLAERRDERFDDYLE